MRSASIFVTLAAALALPHAVAQQAGNLFAERIRPILAKNCLACHSGPGKQSGLDLSTREGLLKGGDNGAAVVAGDPEASRLYQLISHKTEPAMPFKGAKLAAEDIAQIADWIKAGTPYDEPLKASAAAPDHWAFKVPKRPPTPVVRNKAWVRNPVDAFIAAEQEKRGLKPVPEADPRVLLRRVYLDLTGLPPTPEEMRAYLADHSASAYEKVVDKLLASPRYGERWGRHWMDVWRYSDWYGWRIQNQVRYSQRHIWRWRDWIVESLNADKGYDRMIVEMLAGDELAPEDPDITRATGFLGRNWYMFNRNTWLQDTVEHTASGFLGITLKCARCHSHKYDPISHEDYYRFRAFFEPYDVRTDHVPGEADLLKSGLARVYDADAGAPTYRFLRGNETNPDKDHPLTPAVPEVFRADLKIAPVKLPLAAYYPDSRPAVQIDLVLQAKADIEKANAGLAAARVELAKTNELFPKPGATEVIQGNRVLERAAGEDQAFEALLKAQGKVALAEQTLLAARASLDSLQARVAADNARFSDPPSPDAAALAEAALKTERHAQRLKAEEDLLSAQQKLHEGLKSANVDEKNAEKKVAEARAQLEAATAALKTAEAYTPVGKIYPDSSTGRRLALAQWIANSQNPLTARVAVNHIWLRHFGTALVPTVANFGKNGKPPSNPELLDWLATELMAHNWSMKTIHRLIVTSSAYRMQSTPEAADHNAAIDPDNTYFWRMNPRRMEAEAVRDSVLYLAGQLDTTMGGPELDAKTGEESRRRSIYFQHAPDAQMTFLKVFDEASPNECYARNETVVPHQALALANSKLSLTEARLLAKSLAAKSPTATEFVNRAFETVLSRPPSVEERAESEKFLKEQEELFHDPQKLTPVKAAKEQPAIDARMRAREDLVHVLLNHNDFVTIR